MSPLTESVRLTLAKGQPVPNDPYLYTNTVLLLHGDGTNGSTNIVNSSRVAGGPKTVTAVGNAQISTAQSKFGGASIAFDGNGDYLTAPYNSDFAFPGDFTVELWLYMVSHQNFGGIVGCAAPNAPGLFSGGWQLIFNDATDNVLVEYNGGSFTSTSTVPRNAWTHLVLCRSGSNVVFYINGTSAGTSTTSATFNSVTGLLVIGAERTPLYVINGYIDDLRITKGVARYTANFTPPTAPFPDF